MHTTTAIARRDLRSMLLSARAGSVFFLFFLAVGAFFFNYVDGYMSLQLQAEKTGGRVPSSETLLAGVLSLAQFVLILIVPALTMTAFAEERRQGTLKFLRAAPISTPALVLGKYLGVMLLLGTLLLTSLVYPGYLIWNGALDIGVVFTSFLGLYLLMSMQVSFGLWISTRCQSPFTAFLFTLLGLFLLLVANSLTSTLHSDSLWGAVVRYCSVGEHLQSFSKGIITGADTMYFLIFSAVFLTLCGDTLAAQDRR